MSAGSANVFLFFLTFLKQLIPRRLMRREKSKLQKTRDKPTLSLAIHQSITLGSLRSWILRRKKFAENCQKSLHKCPPIILSCDHSSPSPHWSLGTSLLHLTNNEAQNQSPTMFGYPGISPKTSTFISIKTLRRSTSEKSISLGQPGKRHSG